MIGFTTTLTHGLLICLPFTIFSVVSFWRWPRLWLHSLPPDLSEMAGPRTEAEVNHTKWFAIPILFILPGLSIFSIFSAANLLQADLSIIGAFVHLYSIWVIVHLWDLLIIDYGHILFIDPQNPPIPNTEGAAGYRNYYFHFLAFIEASWKSLYFVIPVAVIFAQIF